jgi:hypothetical protein
MRSCASDPNVSYVEVDHRRKASPTCLRTIPSVTGHQPRSTRSTFRRVGGDHRLAREDRGRRHRRHAEAATCPARCLPGYDFVNGRERATTSSVDGTSGRTRHRTRSASLIAARGNNGAGMAGVCWQCQILPVKVLDADGSGDDCTVADGHHLRRQTGCEDHQPVARRSGLAATCLRRRGRLRERLGVMVVAAAGNESTYTRSRTLPRYTDVLAVGATDGATRAWFSNYNYGTTEWVDVAAPGIVSAMNPLGDLPRQTAGHVVLVADRVRHRRPDQDVHPSYTGWSMINRPAVQRHPIGAG